MTMLAALPAISSGTMATMSMASTVISGFMSYLGQQATAAQQANQMRYQAEVDRNNAIIADRAAKDAIDRGRNAEMLQRIKVGQTKGQQINAFAKNGVQVDSGTPLDVLKDTAQFGELDALTIRNNAQREAQGYQTQAGNYTSSAQNNDLAASNTTTAAKVGGITSVLSSVGTVADKWYTYKQAGAWK